MGFFGFGWEEFFDEKSIELEVFSSNSMLSDGLYLKLVIIENKYKYVIIIDLVDGDGIVCIESSEILVGELNVLFIYDVENEIVIGVYLKDNLYLDVIYNWDEIIENYNIFLYIYWVYVCDDFEILLYILC